MVVIIYAFPHVGLQNLYESYSAPTFPCFTPPYAPWPNKFGAHCGEKKLRGEGLRPRVKERAIAQRRHVSISNKGKRLVNDKTIFALKITNKIETYFAHI
jgi:hypothetical protein